MHPPPNPLMRMVYLALGLGFVALAFVGVFLPVLPTVPFLIPAAWAFARSSKRLEGWLLEHRRFGPMLRDWRARGAIPRGAKRLALAGSVFGFGMMRLGGAGLWPSLSALALILAGMAYVFTRPDA